MMDGWRGWGVLLGLWLLLWAPAVLRAQEPTTDPNGEPERLGAPPLPDNPTQLDHGAHEYAQRCMACHGDRGQGLTEEWRAAWGIEEKNCWQSKCHAANHPPEGFKLPEYAPRLIGEGALGRFGSAEALYAFIQARMPWHAPGTLPDEMVWQLTAFLVKSNGIMLPTEPLGPANAATIYLHGPPPTPTPAPPSLDAAAALPPWTVAVWMGGLLTAAALAFGWLLARP